MTSLAAWSATSRPHTSHRISIEWPSIRSPPVLRWMAHVTGRHIPLFRLASGAATMNQCRCHLLMAEIAVVAGARDGELLSFQVRVAGDSSETTHEVTVARDELERLARGDRTGAQ